MPRVEATITPVIVDTPNITGSLANTAQQHILNLTGRTWIFYGDGTNFVYKSSLDRITWTSKTTFHAGGATAGGLFSVVDNSTHIFYGFVGGVASNDVYFNVGTPSGSTISWVGEIQIFDIPATNYGHFGNIALDTNGNPWLAWTHSNPTNGLPYATKLEWSGSSWQNASGFPYLLTTDNTRPWRESLTALSDGTVYVIYNSISVGMKGKLWNGTAWSDEEAVSGSEMPSNYNVFSARAISDVVHVVYNKATSYDIQYRKRESGSWSNITTIKASQSSTSFPFLTTYGDSLFTFWQNNKAMYYSIYTDGSWFYMGQFYSGSTTISGSSPTALYPISGASFPVAWVAGYAICLLDFGVDSTLPPFLIVSEGSQLSEVTFTDEDRTLKFTVTAATSAESVTKVYCGVTYGTPKNVFGSTTWAFDSTTSILTINKTHASAAEFIITFDFNFQIQVVDSVSGLGIENASVYYYLPTWNSSTYLTDVDGYTTALLGRDDYYAVIDALNYTELTYGFSVDYNNQIITISLTAGIYDPYFTERLYVGTIIAVGTGSVLAYWYRRKTKSRTVSIP